MKIRLGHIVYSNCFPVHAGLLDDPPQWLEVRRGVPTALNEALAAGEIDVAPCSSIEYARHRDAYRIIPGPAIASHGPVRSILLETTVAPESLGGRTVAVPTASATSVVLLRALLEQRLGVVPDYTWFDQSRADPLEDLSTRNEDEDEPRRRSTGGPEAVLWIGDVALRRPRRRERRYVDLGVAWREWTGLPFVYAVWQTRLGPDRDDDLRRLAAVLAASKAYFVERARALAARESERLGLAAAELEDYWASLRYELDGRAAEGLLRFYRLAEELDEAPGVDELRFTPQA